MRTNNDAIYLDYAASTPVRPEVLSAMQPYWRKKFANPQSAHQHGRKAQAALKQARESIANTLSVQASEIVFTSGATEANALAVKGRSNAEANDVSTAVISAGSHPSLLSADAAGIQTQLLPLQNDACIDQSEITERISDHTAVVSIPYVNSAVGAIEPLSDISNLLSARKGDGPALHADASQAGVFLSLQPEPLGVDMMTINSHKLYGPKGIGLLWVRSGIQLSSIFLTETDYVVGDYQVLRPGTPPVPLIVGFAKAIELAQKERENNRRAVGQLQDYLLTKLSDLPIEITLNGPRKNRAVYNVNISIADTDHEFLTTQLDQEGVAVSASTACQSMVDTGSPMLANVPDNSDTGLRITLGIDSTTKDIDRLVTAIKEIAS
jgi:cysteine desulfurase